jgi:hypothetical protein
MFVGRVGWRHACGTGATGRPARQQEGAGVQYLVLGSRTDALAMALQDLGEHGWLILTDAEMVEQVSRHVVGQACSSRQLSGTGWRLDLRGTELRHGW